MSVLLTPPGKILSPASTTAAFAPRLSPAPGSLGREVFFVVARCGFGALLLVTSAYCLLLYIPFTYFGFIHNPLLAWLPVFVRMQSYLFAILLAAVIGTLRPALRAEKTRRAAWGFVLIHGGAAVYLLFQPALPTMMRDLFAYVWSMLCLFPLMWLAALDFAAERKGAATRSAARSELSLSTTTFAALVVTGVFAATSFLSHGLHAPGSQSFGWHGLGASLLLHLAVFTALGVAIQLLAIMAHRTPWPERVYSLGAHVVAWTICAEVIRAIILPTLSFDGLQANVFAGVVSLVLVAYASGTMAGLNFVLERRKSRIWILIPGFLGLLAISYAIPARLETTDWDFVLQKTAVVLVWAATVAFLSWAGVEGRGRVAKAATALVLALALAGFGAYKAMAAYRPSVVDDAIAFLDSYAGVDISFKTAYDILSRSVNNDAHDDFYGFLKSRTNLGREAAVGPADVSLVSDLKPTSGVKPNIFIFVIDSLRQDYVSPYNAAVDFTPEIGKFAQDSVVMQNAFTRYAGTALSEPAIWVGAMQLHKQYIEPYYPMNNLQKLIETEGYASYISVDPILQEILRPSASITRLDKDRTFWEDLDFIPTLKELESKIAERGASHQPIFAYTQPQNVHTLTLDRMHGGGSRRDISIREMRRLDAAFGEFIRFLQERGLYDNSIIVLTSDHGDSYGEFGRYGHSDFLFPEIIRIPLIIHLPPKMREKLVWDAQRIAFSLDITPSLYSLLGHRPTRNGELFGRPLFTQTQPEEDAYQRSNYLIASSYAPVYGELGQNGKSLFIVDAVNHRNYFFDLNSDSEGVHNHVTPRVRDENETVIRHELGLIDELYHYVPPKK